MSTRDKRSTLILAVFIALQVIIAVALFAGAGGKKPNTASETVVEAVENSHTDAQEPRTDVKEEPVAVVENPVESPNTRYEEPTHINQEPPADVKPEEPAPIQLEEIAPDAESGEPVHEQP